jgi:hypothetical protein
MRAILLGMAGEHPPTPELLDPVIDAGHRSFVAAVERRELHVLRPRPPAEVLTVHEAWVGRYVFCDNFKVFVSNTYFMKLRNDRVPLQVATGRSAHFGPSCRRWASSARPVPTDGPRGQMEA